MLRLLFPILVVISLSACTNSSKRRNTPYVSSNPPLPFQFKPPLEGTTNAKSPAASATNATQVSTNSTNITTTTTAASPATTAGVNPAHGQPGHRCGTAVGAPLTPIQQAPAPASTVTSKPATNPSITVPQPTTVATPVTSTGKNPSHGQPGHRCDISVGAPLNSAPATASSPAKTSGTTPVVNQSATSVSNQVLPAVTKANSSGNKGMVNPAHGQPGHDCTIAVGQPLKK